MVVKTACSYCNKTFFRSNIRINEARKQNWKPYCSPGCLSAARIKREAFKCSNPRCSNVFERIPSEIKKSDKVFCSRSCSAIINNRERKLTQRKKTPLYPKYAGFWVALASDESTVVASAERLKPAVSKAKKQGVNNPLMFKVPTEMLPYVG